MFSGEHAYRKGWIRVALDPTDTIVGLTCVRHKVKAPETTLYYIVVRPGIRTRGIGTELIVDLMRQCPHPRIVLSCLKKNTPALKFYEKLGFNRVGEALKGEGYQLVKEW